MIHEMVGLVMMFLSYVMCRMLKIYTKIKKEENMRKNKENKIAAFTFLLYSLSYLNIKLVHFTVLNSNRQEMVLHIFLSVCVGSYFIGRIRRRPTGMPFCICYLLRHDFTKPLRQHTK
jgi:heme/copper-type cytochrome/quinol oxidase subunit 3